MSCNGCTALGKSCSDTCVLRPCLQWIESPQAQANTVMFLNNYFATSNFIALVFAILEAQRTAGFQSLLFEACGQLLNPAYAMMGMKGSDMFEACKQAVATVLAGGTVTPISYTQPLYLTLSLGTITTNPSGGSSFNNDEMKTLDLFK